MNKKPIILVFVFVAVFLLGGIVGRGYQHLKTGYHHKILETELYPFSDGFVTLSHTQESIGMPLLNPETSVLTVTTNYGSPITIYKAQRTFQESTPHVQNISTEKNQIIWNDGINTYQLTVEPIEVSEDLAEPSTEGSDELQ